VPLRDSFVTSLSVIATWMLARKIFEHWYLWIVVNFVSALLFLTRGLYPTVILYLVYGVMSFVGLIEWKKTIAHHPSPWSNDRQRRGIRVKVKNEKKIQVK
jgi:nicotinamide mononucleotide transporter PnuC